MASGDERRHLYAQVPDEDQDDSNVEFQVTIETTEKTHSGRQSSWSQLLINTAKSYRWIFEVALVLVIIGLLIDKLFMQNRGTSEYDGSGDITGLAPRFSQKIMTFKPDPEYVPNNASDFFLKETKQKWLDLVPRGLGYHKIENPSDYHDLPTPLASYPDEYVVTTSMTHQLHCLYAIARSNAWASLGYPPRLLEGQWHAAHCFDYLRQSIMCCADVAVEGQQTTFPEGVDGSDGWDAKHVCKDYTQVYDYLEAHRVDDNSWI